MDYVTESVPSKQAQINSELMKSSIEEKSPWPMYSHRSFDIPPVLPQAPFQIIHTLLAQNFEVKSLPALRSVLITVEKIEGD